MDLGGANLASLRRDHAARQMRRRTRWHRGWALCCVLLGAVLLGGAGVAFAVVPRAISTERAFLAARPCRETPVPQRDCVQTVPATVTADLGVTGRGRYRALSTGPGATSRSFALGDGLPKRLRPGASVSVTLWRGYPRSLTLDGRTYRMARVPTDRPELWTALGLMALTGAAFVLYAAAGGWSHAEEFAVEGLPERLIRAGTAAFWTIGGTLAGFVVDAPWAYGVRAVLLEVLVWGAALAITMTRLRRRLAPA